MNLQNSNLWFLKGLDKLEMKFCSNFCLFLFQWKLKVIYFWHAMDKHEKKLQYQKKKKKKGKGKGKGKGKDPWSQKNLNKLILFDQNHTSYILINFIPFHSKSNEFG